MQVGPSAEQVCVDLGIDPVCIERESIEVYVFCSVYLGVTIWFTYILYKETRIKPDLVIGLERGVWWGSKSALGGITDVTLEKLRVFDMGEIERRALQYLLGS
mgnify:CR=1 FL=1